jgi:hypothetical protein
VSYVTIYCRDGACNMPGHNRTNCHNRAAALPPPARETVCMGWDGASNPVIGYRDELSIPRHARTVWVEREPFTR